MHRSLLTALVAVPCIALAIVAVRPAGGAGNAMADSTSVAVMNPSQILEGLAERAEAEAELRARFDELKTEADARTSEIRSLQAQAEQTQDAAARQALIEEIEAKSVRAIAFDQFAARQFDIELALLQQDLYQRIKAATAELAQANGIDIVLVHDGAKPIQVNPELQVARSTQVKDQISERRVIYAAGPVDITEELTLRMNNAHKERTGQR